MSLHWLPVSFRIDFKVVLLVYKSFNGLGPQYIADKLTEDKPNRSLKSLGSHQLEIPRVHSKHGEFACSYYASRSWNQLPEEIRCAPTAFKSHSKDICLAVPELARAFWGPEAEFDLGAPPTRSHLTQMSRNNDTLLINTVSV